ncbi:ABC transporter substrate-binding protein [Leptolyngbya boryana CZ1]|uniref:ABC transporter substrate-binding protein n=1 Tax=Leptolyngbya boryana CZ1 TaxID=3060204 RepID=A0AA96WZG2_LEPBY|nr:ABC transporter substrate-binding protein [Leptolyngbya boryana]WNZ47658.1 ABC transporter substrate-binding protein [Leptolyngbya boryana CZ1]
MTSIKPNKSVPPIVYIAALVLLVGVGFRSCNTSNSSSDSPVNLTHVENLTSSGDRAFFPKDGTLDKISAIAAYKSENYSQAELLFARSLQQKPNDPESWIYRNNTRAALNSKRSLAIAVSIPGDADANGSREILRGVAQAQTEINLSGGINGQALVVIIASDDNDVNTARSVASAFVNLPDIYGVVGHYASNITLETGDIYTNGELVTISPISSAVQLSNYSDYVFRTVPSDEIAARALTDYMTQTLKRKRAVIYFNSQSDYSKSLKGELSTAIALQGGQIVGEYDLANSSFSPNQSLEEVAQRGAEVILLASNTGSLDRALQVVQANNNRLPILGGDDVYSPKTLDVARAKGREMVLAVPWHILGTGSENFAQRSRKFWGGDVNWRTATAYDATQALSAALQQDPSRRGVQKALKHPNFSASGASRTIDFLPSGDRNAPVQLVKVVASERSENEFRFVPVPQGD